MRERETFLCFLANVFIARASDKQDLQSRLGPRGISAELVNNFFADNRQKQASVGIKVFGMSCNIWLDRRYYKGLLRDPLAKFYPDPEEDFD